MADTAELIDFFGTGTAGYNDSITEQWQVIYDDIPDDYYDAEVRAHVAGLPARRAAYASTSLVNTYVTQLDGRKRGENRQVWDWTVVYTTPPPVEFAIFATAVPTDRSATYDIRYIERERVLEKAKNVSALSHGDGKGGNRAADTLGPIVNAAGKRPDEPIVVTERLPVLVIRKNYATLAAIEGLNNTYFQTTNSDIVGGVYPVRSLRYLLTTSLGGAKENGTTYYAGETEILVEGNTDLTIDNVGYEYWSTGDSDWKRAKDAEGNFMAEPINLKLDGDLGGDNTTTITYRHLSAVAYSSLFS